jgi:hypothetical protein
MKPENSAKKSTNKNKSAIKLIPRLMRILHTMLDKIELVLTMIERRDAPPPAELLTADLAPASAAAWAAPWRWANNAFGFWRLCARPACRRARCCRGESRACLDRHLPHVSPDARNRVRAMLRARRLETMCANAAPSTSPAPAAARQPRPTPGRA